MALRKADSDRRVNHTEKAEMQKAKCFERFLPRSRSKTVFVFVITCYTFTLQSLNWRLIRLFASWPKAMDPQTRALQLARPGVDDTIVHTVINKLVIAPVVESLIVIAVIELLRRLKFSVVVQIIISASLSCFFHSIQIPLWGLEVAPVFFIGAGAYVYWRRVSFWTGTQMIILLHCFHNVIIFIGFLAERLSP
jgi:hypothetical protein